MSKSFSHSVTCFGNVPKPIQAYRTLIVHDIKLRTDTVCSCYNGLMLTVGIDEVGRGCWAGPLVAGAVILPSNFRLEVGPLDSIERDESASRGRTSRSVLELRDSKKLSKKQRETLAVLIQEQALAIGIGWVWPEAIDTGGITQAVKMAMQQALAAIQVEYDDIIVDGNINYFVDNPKARAVIRADDIFPSVSAASIVAKVARDAYMAEAAEKYPGYAFEKHVGYGTAAHIAALKLHGVSDIHRQSYKPIQVLLGATA